MDVTEEGSMLQSCAGKSTPLPTVMDHLGNVLTVHDLPEPGDFHWTPGRKLLFVLAIKKGLLTQEDFLARHNVTPQEFADMQESAQQLGVGGLRVTRWGAYQTAHTVPIMATEEYGPWCVMEVGKIVFDPNSKRITINDCGIHLTWTEYDILHYLVRHRGAIVSKQTLYHFLYGKAYKVSSKIIDVYICKLRKKIAKYDPRPYIDTIWGRGYRLFDPPEDSI